jgi:hypothetical protein
VLFRSCSQLVIASTVVYNYPFKPLKTTMAKIEGQLLDSKAVKVFIKACRHRTYKGYETIL